MAFNQLSLSSSNETANISNPFGLNFDNDNNKITITKNLTVIDGTSFTFVTPSDFVLTPQVPTLGFSGTSQAVLVYNSTESNNVDKIKVYQYNDPSIPLDGILLGTISGIILQKLKLKKDDY